MPFRFPVSDALGHVLREVRRQEEEEEDAPAAADRTLAVVASTFTIHLPKLMESLAPLEAFTPSLLILHGDRLLRTHADGRIVRGGAGECYSSDEEAAAKSSHDLSWTMDAPPRGVILRRVAVDHPGVHHSKLSLVIRERSMVVVVSTENLGFSHSRDGVWYESFPTASAAPSPATEFQSELLAYVTSLGRHVSLKLTGLSVLDHIRRTTFTTAARLVFSEPLGIGTSQQASDLISTLGLDSELAKSDVVVFHPSAIGGNLDMKWQRGVIWRLGRAISAAVVWPTEAAAATTACTPFFSTSALRAMEVLRPTKRPKPFTFHAPTSLSHVKMYARLDVHGNTRWLLLTSACLSRGSLGRCPANFEVGVLLRDVAMPRVDAEPYSGNLGEWTSLPATRDPIPESFAAQLLGGRSPPKRPCRV